MTGGRGRPAAGLTRGCVPALLAAALLALPPSSVAARAQDGGSGATTLDAVFSAEQAERGREVYSESCAHCHPTSRFTGDSFRPSWSRAPVSTLFTVVRSQMPFDNPGSLDPEEYAAVLAYLFQLNDLPAGERELPAAADSLRGLTIRFGSRPEGDSGSDEGPGGGDDRPR